MDTFRGDTNMKDDSELEAVRGILAAVLTLLAAEPETQVQQLSTFFNEVGRRCENYDLQHPLVEITEWICKIPWSDDSPREVVEILEEIDGLTTLMFRDKELVSRFTSADALLDEPNWRVVRKLARDALAKAKFQVPLSSIDFTALVLTVAD